MLKKILISGLFLTSISVSVYAKDFVVNDIHVNGVTKEQQETIVSLLGLKIGEKLNYTDLDEIKSKLIDSKKFSSVEVNYKNGVVVLDVVVAPVVAYIDVKGAKLISKDQIITTLDSNGVFKGAPLNKSIINELSRELEKAYRSQGYDNINISENYKTREDGSVIVTINVIENGTSLLTDVKFIGNEHFSAREILSDSTLIPNAFIFNPYASSKITSHNLQAFSDYVSNFYKNHGYAAVTINDVKEIKPIEGKRANRVGLEVDLTEGDLYHISNIDVSLYNNDELLKEINNLIKIKDGSLYNQSKLEQLKADINYLLLTKGYYKSNVELNVSLDYFKNTAAINYAIDTGIVYKVRRIEFTGNNSTADLTLRRDINQSEDSVLNKNLLDQGKEKLQRTGYYKNIDYTIIPIDGTDLVDVLYRIEEVNTGSISAGFGYGSSEGFSIQAGIKQKNFLGTGNDIAFEISRSKSNLGGNLSFTQPYFTYYGLSLTNNVGFSIVNTRKQANSELSGYKNKSLFYSFNVGVPIDKYMRINLGAGYNYSYSNNLNPEYSRYQYLKSINQIPVNNDWEITTKNISLNLGYSYNTLNSSYFPTSGFNLGANINYIGLLSTDKFISTGLNAKGYYSFDSKDRFILIGSFDYNHSISLFGKQLPANSLNSAGGIGSIRGFSNNSIGVQGVYCNIVAQCYGDNIYSKFTSISGESFGGDSKVTASVELALPLFGSSANSNLRFTLFADAGTVWDTKWKQRIKQLPSEVSSKLNDYSNFSRLRVSTGVSIQWLSPIAPLTFSYGIPIKKYKYDERESFQFNIGYFF